MTAEGATATYIKSVRDYVVANGPTRLSEIGSKIAKVPGVKKKVKPVLEDSKLFTIDAQQIVHLAS